MGQVWLEPHNATDMLEKITIPGFRNSFKPTVTQREELKELAKAFRRDDGQTVQAGRVRIEYQERGTTYEEDFIIVLTYYTLKTTFGTIINWSPAIMPMAIRAKKGQLDPQRATLMSIALSLRPTPEYYQTIRLAQTRFIGNMAEFQRLDRMDAAAIDKSRADLQAITQSIWKERGESQDRTYQTRNDLLGGVAPYQGRDREFILPHSHKFTWSSDDGTTVILTNDPNYDPNIGSRDGWQKLSVVKR
jgi:hypothetical protein